MNIKTFTRIVGFLVLAVGVLGFIPAVLYAPRVDDPGLLVSSFYGRIFGLFPSNSIHAISHMAVGIWALVAAREVLASRRFCKAAAVIFGVFTLFGFVPGLNVFFGLMPVFSHDIWLNALLTVGTGYFGYVWDRAEITLSRPILPLDEDLDDRAATTRRREDSTIYDQPPM